MCMCTCQGMYIVHTHVFMYVCMYMFIYIYIYIHIPQERSYQCVYHACRQSFDSRHVRGVDECRYPLLIDPHGQGVAWIKKRGKGAGLSIADMHTTVSQVRAGERTLLEDCILSGRHMLLDNVTERVDSILYSVIRNRVLTTGKRVTLALGARQVEYTSSFRLMLACALTSPTFSEDLAAHVNVIDFSMTMEGLQRQLLDLVLDNDKNDVHKQSVQVRVRVAALLPSPPCLARLYTCAYRLRNVQCQTTDTFS
jgi:hypothetical protein